MKILLFSYLLLQIWSSVYAAAVAPSRSYHVESSSGSITGFADSISVETPYFHIGEYSDGLLASLHNVASSGSSIKKPEPLRLEIPVTCNTSASVYTTTLMPTPGPFGIYTITTTKTETVPLTTTTATTTFTKTVTTDGFDFFGQKRTTTLFNTTTVFNNLTMTQTDISSTTIISTKLAAPATPSTQYITVTPSKEYVTVTATQSKETVTTTATPSKEYITIISTPSKEYITVTATPNKELITITAAPSKEYITVTANPQTTTTTVTTTKGAGGLFDGIFGTQTTATGAIVNSLCSNTIVTVTSAASKEYITVTASPQTLTSTVTTTKTTGGIFDGIFGTQTTAPGSAITNLCSNTIGGGGTTKTITMNNTVTRTETSRINATITQTFTLAEVITASCPMPPLPTQTTTPGPSMADTLNVLRVILKVIQALQGDKLQFNPVLELIKTVIQQAIKQDDEKNVQAVLAFVFDLIQKNSSQASNNKMFPFTKRRMMNGEFEAQAKEWLINQFIDV
ncbi:hypothetical protein MAM1_0286d09249 [Mucor ambiguus]|uniref:Uncharacterized protein n=1 Tax=Mucor ambiguus TaxID=91626 RepID=A0A0C9N1A0_9FUNG|nr:hypothetical protein MAM1_0286d09249 [Mucor ambiguus]